MLHSGWKKRALALIMVMVLSFGVVSSAVGAEGETNTGASESSGEYITTTISPEGETDASEEAGEDETATATDATGSEEENTTGETGAEGETIAADSSAENGILGASNGEDETLIGTEENSQDVENAILLGAEQITVSLDDISSYTLTTRTLTVTLLDNESNTMATVSVTDAKRYSVRTGNGPTQTTTYYFLIPVSYLEDTYGEYGYTFNDAEASDCSFNYNSLNGTQADYVTDGTNYYLRFTGTGQNQTTVSLYYTNELVEEQEEEVTIVTDTENPSGTVIHLFDYWSTTNRTDPDRTDYLSGGINSNRTLKFASNGGSGYNGYAFNSWTGNASVFQNIVQKVLVNGYPSLNATVTGSTESLDYLFDPTLDDATVGGRKTFENVQGLLQVDDNGYYYYDSSQNYAEFDESTNSFTLYSTWAYSYLQNNGQFFPFNSFAAASKTTTPQANYTETGEVINHYFGLSMTTRFIQRYHGHTSSEESTNNETTFEFAGDDDVWIFVDDVLIGDIGGIHDESTISINFATGVIVVNAGTSYQSTTTIYAQFVAAGKEDTVSWITADNGNYIFADDSYHTLKFYYLERGNTASELKLQFNLIEIPESSVYKVDQYGDPVEGATFAIYEAQQGEAAEDGEYTYYYVVDSTVSSSVLSELSDLTTVNGKTVEEATSVSAKLDSGEYQYVYSNGVNTGDIHYNGTVIYSAKYTGTTDSIGEMKFRDKYDSAYTINELKELFGSQYFIMREIVIPDGYRMVSEEIYMEITDKGLLTCNNTYTSGVYASAIEMVTATDRLYYTYNTYANGSTSTAYRSVLYNDITSDTVNGILFAVVVKYTGSTTLTADNWETVMSDQKNWTPVYGSDDVGYTLQSVDYGSYDYEGQAFVEAAIAAAKEQSTISDVLFSQQGYNGAMMLTLTNLPGDISTYYHMLGENEKENTQYTLAYYWVDADSLDDADYTNTYRVLSDPFESLSVTNESGVTSTVDYDGFDRIFGATINIPNLINRFFVQKLNEKDELVNGAVFGLYEVQEVTTGTTSRIYYVATDGTLIYLEGDEDNDSEIDNTGRARLQGGLYTDGYTYTVSEEETEYGVITVTNGTNTYTIEPVQVKETVSAADPENPSYEEGTACFTYMTEGTYYVREISAPAGYTINTTEIMVLVKEDAIYANAGTSSDNVSVARGAGYLVSSLERFASEGEIDRTLSWIYEYLIVNTKDRNTFNIGDPYSSTDTDWSKVEDYTSYLEYSPLYDQLDFVFDYISNTERGENGSMPAADSVETRRLFAEEGWVALNIWQDYEYGSAQAANATYNYDEIGHSITHLFSRSLYIRVVDETETYDVEFMKVDGDDANATDADDDRELDTNEYTPVDGVVFTIYHQIVLTDEYGNDILDDEGNVQLVWVPYTTERKVQATYSEDTDYAAANYQVQMISDNGNPIYYAGSAVMLDLYVQMSDSDGTYTYVKLSELDLSTVSDPSKLLLYVPRTESDGTPITDADGEALYEPVYQLEYDDSGAVKTDEDGNYIFVTEATATYVSGSSGVSGLVTFTDMPVGDYMISETVTVNGYDLSTWECYVNIAADKDTGEPTITITSSRDTTAAGFYAYYYYSETQSAADFDEESLLWYTDITETASGTTVYYYYWPNYSNLFDFEFIKIDGSTVQVSDEVGADKSVLITAENLTALEGVEFTIYVKEQQLVTDENGNALNAAGDITTDESEYQYEDVWVEYEYTTYTVQVFDDNGDPILDKDGNYTYTTVNTAVATSDSSGLVNFTSLPAGTYKVAETRKAGGYQKISWYWEVTIGADGSIQISPSADSNGTDETTGVDQLTLYTYTVQDTDNLGYDTGTVLYYWPNYLIDYDLPATGRGGIYWPTLVGVVIMCIAAGAYIHCEYVPRRRRRKAAK